MGKQPPTQHQQKQQQYHHLQRNRSTTQPVVPLYHSTVFRYSCKGRLKLDSKFDIEKRGGICQGIQSQLHAVEHLRLGTRDDALQYFQQKSALGSIDNDHEPGRAGAPDASVAGGPGGAGAEALQTAYMSNVLVYPNTPAMTSSEKDDDGEKEKEKMIVKRSKPKEEESDSGTEETWSCVGSTEIDLLVLRPENSNEEEIVAISPYCSPGMTTRDVATPTLGKDRTSTLRLGFFEIVYVSSVIDDEDDLEEEQDQILNSKTNDTATTTDNNNKINPKVPATNTTRRRTTTKERQQSKSMPIKMYNSASNIWNHMQINARLLYEATQDDFTNRTLTSSKRIIKEFETTKNRTIGLMKRVLLWDWDDKDDGSGGSNNRK